MINNVLMQARLLPLIVSILITLLACDPGKESVQEQQQLLIKKLSSLDQPLPTPQPGDWLYVHNEKGQTFAQYKVSKPVKPDSLSNTIYLLPMGEFTPWQDSVLLATEQYLNIFFNLKTKMLPHVGDNVTPDTNTRKFGRLEQLLTTDILNYLRKAMPEDGLVIMAITSKDLYGGPQYNFVFGQARAKQRVAVSSIARYYNGTLDSAGYPLVLERLIKTSAHEIGHMFSCQHCINAVCLMNGSNSLEESDSRPNRLCSQCHQKLQWNLGFDVRESMEGLGSFFKVHRLERDQGLIFKDAELLK
jgi:archaemetzincin